MWRWNRWRERYICRRWPNAINDKVYKQHCETCWVKVSPKWNAYHFLCPGSGPRMERSFLNPLPLPPAPPFFFLHFPWCSDLQTLFIVSWQMMAGWHGNAATGREAKHTPHGRLTNKEIPHQTSCLLLCSSSALCVAVWCAKHCACSAGLWTKVCSQLFPCNTHLETWLETDVCCSLLMNHVYSWQNATLI